MYKILTTLSVALLACSLSNGWPFAATEQSVNCGDVVKTSTHECNKTVVESYMKTPLIKNLTKAAMDSDKDKLALLQKKAECCIGTDILMCIEKDISVIIQILKLSC